MISNPAYKLDVALLHGARQFVIVDGEDRLHVASSWLQFLTDVPRSPNTVKNYGSRVASYLSWTAGTADWRAVNVSHVALWRRLVATVPYRKANGVMATRTDKTASLYISSLRSFYEWADAEGLLTSDIASRMTQVKYFAPGTGPGGEYGARRRVLAELLRPALVHGDDLPQWIDSGPARQKLIALELRSRDRFLVDLLYDTGIRVGEALSLFTRDVHFARDSRALGCKRVGPHFHVRLDNTVENGARAKGRARSMYVSEGLVERYIDYTMERRALGVADKSKHVFVNLYTRGDSLGRAMSYSGAAGVMKRCSKRIGFDMTGPHILRHTFATRMVQGIECEPQSLHVVQALMGHVSIESTRIYTHATEAAKKAATLAVAARTLDLGIPDE